jgi:hypothetical protein
LAGGCLIGRTAALAQSRRSPRCLHADPGWTSPASGRFARRHMSPCPGGSLRSWLRAASIGQMSP